MSEEKQDYVGPNWTWEEFPEGDPRREGFLREVAGEDERPIDAGSLNSADFCGWIEPAPGKPWIPGEHEKKLAFEERARKLGLRLGADRWSG